jgi:pyruvate dehydrogenase E2 component (dihydrolipoamide acetyltransferase)
MAFEVVVPRLGWSMEEGVFLEWLKRDGDSVAAGEMLFVLEGEKAAQEIESIDSGILRIPPNAPEPGATVAVGAVLAYLLAPGETPPWEALGATSAADENPAPSAPTLARPVPIARSEPEGIPKSQRAEPPASPRARRVAGELGVDWRAVAGTGRTGRIRERDIRAAAKLSAGKPGGTAAGRITPISPVRKLIADRMFAGVHATAPVTLTSKVDATNIVNLREQFKATAGELVPSFTDLMVKLVALALREHRSLNAAWTPEGIVTYHEVHVGIAVDTDAGLFVPVIHDVLELTLRDVAERSRSLIELARGRKLAPEQSRGGTFTITNLGMYGIDAFTPIINLPQAAILGIGRITREPTFENDHVVPRSAMTLSLTFDHRIVDGGPAARFLKTLREFTEQPGPRLIP